MTTALKIAGIAFTTRESLSGSVYFTTKNGDIRVSDHNENYKKLNNNKGYLFFDTAISNYNNFRTKSDKKAYDYKIEIAVKSVL